MPYMAVGSRQILFSDSPAPHSSHESARQVSNMTDNPADRASANPVENRPDAVVQSTQPIPSANESTGGGAEEVHRVDVRA